MIRLCNTGCWQTGFCNGSCIPVGSRIKLPNDEEGKVLSVNVHHEACWHAEILLDSGETYETVFSDLILLH